MFATLEAVGAPRCLFLSDASSGLRAILVLDDLTLGPAAGGVRTRSYETVDDALREVAGLAAAMTVKCALAGLAAGGGKAVVMEHPAMNRAAAFEALGRYVEELKGLFRTAGDLGTSGADLAAMARQTQYVHAEEAPLVDAVGRGLLGCLRACAEARGRDVAGLKVAVQGCGAIGAAVAEALVEAKCEVLVADVDAERASLLARRIGARVVDPAEILSSDVDVVSPCAIGGVLDERAVAELSCWAVCGAANNIVADDAAAQALHDRAILHVPDVIASAGAVADGIGRTVMGLEDRDPLIVGLGETAATVLRVSRSQDLPTPTVAKALARQRIADAHISA